MMVLRGGSIFEGQGVGGRDGHAVGAGGVMGAGAVWWCWRERGHSWMGWGRDDDAEGDEHSWWQGPGAGMVML